MQESATPASTPQRRKSVAILIGDGASTTSRRKSMITCVSAMPGLKRDSRRSGAADTLSNPSSPTTTVNTAHHQKEETPPPHCTSSFAFCTYDQIPFSQRERATEVLRSTPSVQSWEDVDAKCTQVLQIVATNANPISSRRLAELSGFSQELLNSPYMIRPDEFLHILNLVVINQNNKLPIPVPPTSDQTPSFPSKDVGGGGSNLVGIFTGISEQSGVTSTTSPPRQTPRQAASLALTRQKEVTTLASPKPSPIGSYNDCEEREKEMQAAVAFAMESLEAYSAALRIANDSDNNNTTTNKNNVVVSPPFVPESSHQQPLPVSNTPASMLSPTASYSGGGGDGGLGNKVNWVEPSISSTVPTHSTPTISIAEALGLPVPHQDFAVGGSVPNFNEIRANRRQDVAKMFVESIRGGFGGSTSGVKKNTSFPNQQPSFPSSLTHSPVSPSSPAQTATANTNPSNPLLDANSNDKKSSDPVSDILFNHMNLVPEDFVSLFSESTEEKAVRWAYRQLGAVWSGSVGGGNKSDETASGWEGTNLNGGDGSEGQFILHSDTLYRKSIQCGNSPEVASALVATFDVSSEGIITFDQFCNGLAQRVELSQVLPPSRPPTSTNALLSFSSSSPHLMRFMIGALRRLINHKPSSSKVRLTSSNATTLSKNAQQRSTVDFPKTVRAAMIRINLLKGTIRTGERANLASDLEENLEETYRFMTQLFSQAYRHMKVVSKTLSRRRQLENDLRVKQLVRRWKSEGEFLLPHRSDDENEHRGSASTIQKRKNTHQNRKKLKNKGGATSTRASNLSQSIAAVQDLTVDGLPAGAPQNRFLATERSASSSSASSGGRSLLNEPEDDDDDDAAFRGGSSPVSTAPTHGSHTASRSSSVASSEKFVVVSRRFTVKEGGSYNGDTSTTTTRTALSTNSIAALPPQHAVQEPSLTPPSSSAACPEADAPLPSPTTDRAAPFGASKVARPPPRPLPQPVVETKQEGRERRMKASKGRRSQTKDTFVYTPLWSSTSGAPPTHAFMKGVSGKPCEEDGDLLASAPTHPSVHCGFKMASRRPITVFDCTDATATNSKSAQQEASFKGNGGYFIPNRPPPIAPAPPTPPPPPPPADNEEKDTDPFNQEQHHHQLNLSSKSSKAMESSLSMKSSINNPARIKEKPKRGHSLNKAYVFGASTSKRTSSASEVIVVATRTTGSNSEVAVDGSLGMEGDDEQDGEEEGEEDSDDSSSVASMFAHTSKGIDMATELNYFTSKLNDHQKKVIARDAARRKRKTNKGQRRSTRAKSSGTGGAGGTSSSPVTSTSKDKVTAKDAGGFHPSEMRPIGELLTSYALGKDMRPDKLLGDKAGFRSLEVLPPIRPSHSRQAQFGGTYLSCSPRWKSGETLFVAPPASPSTSSSSRNRAVPAPPPSTASGGARLTNRHQQQQQQQQVPQSA